MKRIVCFLLFLCIFDTSVAPVSAHELGTDGTIGAVMHIDPDDDPIVGQPSYFFFEFKDRQNKFESVNCDCTAAIYENGRQIFSQPLFQNNSGASLTNSSFSYSFPNRDVYTIKLIGKSVQANAFQPFTISYDVRVSRTATTTNSNSGNFMSSHWIHLVGAIIIFGILIVTLFIQGRKGKKSPN